MSNLLGVLLLTVLPAISAAEPYGGLAFDQQLERFTQLAMEGKSQEAMVFLRLPGFLHAADHEGRTALFAAAVACNTDVLDQVLARGPQLDHRDNNGATALFYAASRGRTDVLRRLIQHGANVNLSDTNGRTPLMASVLMHHPEATRLLLDAKVDVNRQDRDGATALLDAVDGGHYDLADLLLKHGADPRLARNNGTTPLQVARAKSLPKIVELLRQDEAAEF
jgi:ankyrin repeat protein